MVDCWQLCRPEALHIREWDDGGVIYDAISGSTHVIDLLGLELLELLRQHPWQLEALTLELADARADELTAIGFTQQLRAKLTQLSRLDLVIAPTAPPAP